MILGDLAEHFLIDIRDQMLQTHDTALSCLKRLSVFSVHRTKTKEFQAGLFFYKASLACAAEHLDEMHLLTLVHHIDDFVRIKQLAALDDGRKVGRRIKRSSVGFQNDARRHFLRVRILCDIHDQCALIHVRIAFFFHFFYHLRYIRLRVRLFFPEIKLYVQISVVLLQVRDRNI